MESGAETYDDGPLFALFAWWRLSSGNPQTSYNRSGVAFERQTQLLLPVYVADILLVLQELMIRSMALIWASIFFRSPAETCFLILLRWCLVTFSLALIVLYPTVNFRGISPSVRPN